MLSNKSINSKFLPLLGFQLLLCIYAFADNDTLKKAGSRAVSEFYYENHWKTSFNPPSLPLDTSLTQFQQYSPYFFNFQYAGNPGLAAQSLIFNPFRETNWLSGQKNFNIVTKTHNDIRFFNTRKRLSEINYILGAYGEQMLKLQHSQNLNPYWNFGFNMDKINTDGFLKRQATDISNYDIHGWHRSQNSKYLLFASFLSNKTLVQENGGITNDNIYNNSNEISQELIPVKLSSASNKIQNKSLNFSQFFSFGNFFSKKDSLKTNKFASAFRLSHSVNLDRTSWIYSDQNSGSYYSNFYYNSAFTKDSIHLDRMKNEISLSYFTFQPDSEKEKYLSISFFAANIINKYFQSAVNYNFVNTSAGAHVSGVLGKVNCLAFLDYQILGSNKSEFIEKTELKYLSSTQSEITLNFNFQNRSPEHIYHRFEANNFVWNNTNLKKINSLNTGLSYVNKKYHFKMKLDYFNVSNYTYFGFDTLPKQLNNTLNLFLIEFNKVFHWKRLHFSNTVWFQQTNQKNVLSLPQFMNLHSLYLETKLFNKALYSQFGIDLRFFETWMGDSYMPATRQFFRASGKKMGNYPVFDLFFNFKIKSARMFLKMENVNAGFPFKGYYLLPNNPYPARAFKFGISWRFLD